MTRSDSKAYEMLAAFSESHGLHKLMNEALDANSSSETLDFYRIAINLTPIRPSRSVATDRKSLGHNGLDRRQRMLSFATRAMITDCLKLDTEDRVAAYGWICAWDPAISEYFEGAGPQPQRFRHFRSQLIEGWELRALSLDVAINHRQRPTHLLLRRLTGASTRSDDRGFHERAPYGVFPHLVKIHFDGLQLNRESKLISKWRRQLLSAQTLAEFLVVFLGSFPGQGLYSKID